MPTEDEVIEYLSELKGTQRDVSAPGTASLTGEEVDFSERRSGQVGGGEPGRQQRFDVAQRLGAGQFCEHPTQVGVGFESVRLRALDERVQPGAGTDAGHRIGEEPASASAAERAFILPISGRTARFTIAGIRCTGDLSDSRLPDDAAAGESRA